MMKKDIVHIPEEDPEWREIVDNLVESISGEDIPDKVVRAAEMMLVGLPTYKIAQKLNVKTGTVRSWLSKYPQMAYVVSAGTRMLSSWRMGKMEEQFLTAIQRSQEILEVPLSGYDHDEDKHVDPKILTVVAAQARYIIGLFIGQQSSLKVTHELGDNFAVLKATQSALDYVANRMAEIQSGDDPLETVITVYDVNTDTHRPYLDNNGNPPFGELGILDVNEDGMMCHICGNRFKDLRRHLIPKHNMQAIDYETLYMLDEGSIP